jgi:hypothetical protein
MLRGHGGQLAIVPVGEPLSLRERVTCGREWRVDADHMSLLSTLAPLEMQGTLEKRRSCLFVELEILCLSVLSARPPRLRVPAGGLGRAWPAGKGVWPMEHSLAAGVAARG